MTTTEYADASEFTNSRETTEEKVIMLSYDSVYSDHPLTFRKGTVMDANPEYIRFRRDGEDWYVFGTDARGYEKGDVVKNTGVGKSRRVGTFDSAEVWGYV